MEAVARKPFQGVQNIIRFNWHFYAGAAVVLLLLVLAPRFFPPNVRWLFVVLFWAVLVTTLASLAVSLYVYDLSGFYRFHWLNEIAIKPGARAVNVHAGFDETSALLARRYPKASLTVLDFYDPAKHTEVSIERARKAYSSFPGTLAVDTSALPLEPKSVDCVFCLFAAHEIRNRSERIRFFEQLHRCLQPNGRIVVVEHLRDGPNFLAYTVGFLHFHSRSEWQQIFSGAGLQIITERRLNPFVTLYILVSDGTAS